MKLTAAQIKQAKQMRFERGLPYYAARTDLTAILMNDPLPGLVSLTLPFPISQNRIWRRSGNRIHISKEYAEWKAEADAAFLQQRKKCGAPIDGHFSYHFVFDENERKNRRDGDNLQKCVLDWCQRAGLIKDDKFADSGSWSWGPVEGCFVRLYKVAVA